MLADVITELLEDGADDWVMLGDVGAYIRRHQGIRDEADLKREALTVINLVLAAGCFECGDIVIGKGFVPWNLGREESLKKIDTLWDKPFDRIIAECWFNLTDAGKEEVRRLGL